MGDARFKNHPLAKDVTPAQRRRLIQFTEECAEAIVAATKIMRFGWQSRSPFAPGSLNNAEQLAAEQENIREAMDLLDSVWPTYKKRRRRADGSPASATKEPTA